MLKVCSKCGNSYPNTIEYFGKNKDKTRPDCKKCANELRRKKYKFNCKQESERKRTYYLKNKDSILKRQREYNLKNYDDRMGYAKSYRENNRTKIRERWKEHYEKYKKKIIKNTVKYRKARYGSDPIYRLQVLMRNYISKSLKGNKQNKSWHNCVDYTLDELKTHLEILFKEGMTWDNYGEWHVDHIKPVSKFIFKLPEDEGFKKCWSLDNLQPLWGTDNIKKGNC